MKLIDTGEMSGDGRRIYVEPGNGLRWDLSPEALRFVSGAAYSKDQRWSTAKDFEFAGIAQADPRMVLIRDMGGGGLVADVALPVARDYGVRVPYEAIKATRGARLRRRGQ